MKRRRRAADLIAKRSWEYEILGGISGLLLLVCAGFYLCSEEYADIASVFSMGVGGVMNAVLCALMLQKKHILPGGVFGAAAGLLIALFFVRLAGLEV